MLVGVPKEIKNREYRVGLTPDSVREFVAHGHQVLVEHDAGQGVGYSAEDYRRAGATIADEASRIYREAELIVKIKEPQPDERRQLRPDQILFTYLHLAPDPEQTHDLVDSGAVCIAYETVTDEHGGLPLLAPMSQVAGRMSIQAGAHCMEKAAGGAGILPGGVPGVPPARVTVIGGGVVGENAIAMGIGLGAHVVALDRDVNVLRRLATHFGPALTTVYSSRQAVEDQVLAADLVIGAVLIAGAETPKLVTREMVSRMRPGSVLVDVAIDQGGCFETSHPTTHDAPTFTIDGVVHYCVANMPGAVPRTSTLALNNVTLPYALALADQGFPQALANDPHLLDGLNVCRGHVTYKAVADELGYPYVPPREALKG
ncbi:alanine dehydrogenase [Arhodomonas sp. SL1]|uniref:alanine dehydrogenase n=1 Tax=Arhodomonas sp. SL1 TaxID=3425691 RepID=UPI003F880BDE